MSLAAPPSKPLADLNIQAGNPVLNLEFTALLTALRSVGYELLEELAPGGMGRVFVAKTNEGRLVVIKTPHDQNEELRYRFLDEARLGFLVHHPNLVETLHLFELKKRPFLVVGHLDGIDLQARIDESETPLPLDDVGSIGVQILRGLHALHNAVSPQGKPLEAMHRDVTPRNILLDKNGQATLIDFGICSFADRLCPTTAPGEMAGTLRFLAPELWSGGNFSPQSDMWSLGMCLLEAALGRKILVGSFPVVVGKIASGDFFPKDSEKLEPQFLAVLKNLMASDPDKRPRSAGDAAEILSGVFPLGTVKKTPAAKSKTLLIRAQDILQVDSESVAETHEKNASPPLQGFVHPNPEGDDEESSSLRPLQKELSAAPDGKVLEVDLRDLASLRERHKDPNAEYLNEKAGQNVARTVEHDRQDLVDLHSLATEQELSEEEASRISTSSTGQDPFAESLSSLSWEFEPQKKTPSRQKEQENRDALAEESTGSFEFIPQDTAAEIGLLPSTNSSSAKVKSDESVENALKTSVVNIRVQSDALLESESGELTEALLSTHFISGIDALLQHNQSYNALPGDLADDRLDELNRESAASAGGQVGPKSSEPLVEIPSTSDELGAYLRQVQALEKDAVAQGDDWQSTQTLAILNAFSAGKIRFPWEVSSSKGTHREEPPDAIPETHQTHVLEMLVHSGLFSSED